MEDKIVITLTREEVAVLNNVLYKNIETLNDKVQGQQARIEYLEKNKTFRNSDKVLDCAKELFEDISKELAQCDELWKKLRGL